MADQAVGTGRVVVVGDGPPPAAYAAAGAPCRELAQRRSGTIEVRLLWRPASDTVELSVRDVADGTGFRVDVARADAIEAFYHPYAYATHARPSSIARCEVSVDG